MSNQPHREARAGLHYGQLWQMCELRGCDREPVCVNCFLCERHCSCPPPPTAEERAAEELRAQQRREQAATDRKNLALRIAREPEDTTAVPIEIQGVISSGTYWDWVRTPERIGRLLDAVIAREVWYAPRVNREPLTSRRELLLYLAEGHTLNYDSEWYAKIRCRPDTEPAP